MIAEILSIGTELLMGQISNTDAQYISRRLSELGISIYRQTTVGDNNGRVKEAIAAALSRSDIVITTGGLGPTEDDLTKETVAEALGLDMVFDEDSKRHVETWMHRIGKEMTPNNLRQAYFPRGAIIMPNTRGTAPGCIVRTKDGKSVAILPGPTHELQAMFENALEPYLRSLTDTKIESRYLHIFGVGESKVETILKDLFHSGNPTLALYCGAGQVYARLTARVHTDEDADALLDPLENEIRARLGDSIYGSGLETTLSRVTVDTLTERKETLSLAEGATGGCLASSLTDIPGAGRILKGSFITCNDAALTATLGIDPAVIREFGAVSAECAEAMAGSCQRMTGSDWAVATCGITGPEEAAPNKPVGLAYIAVAHSSGDIRVFRHEFRGERTWIKLLISETALDHLRRVIAERT